jgi:hypothetical protein
LEVLVEVTVELEREDHPLVARPVVLELEAQRLTLEQCQVGHVHQAIGDHQLPDLDGAGVPSDHLSDPLELGLDVAHTVAVEGNPGIVAVELVDCLVQLAAGEAFQERVDLGLVGRFLCARGGRKGSRDDDGQESDSSCFAHGFVPLWSVGVGSRPRSPITPECQRSAIPSTVRLQRLMSPLSKPSRKGSTGLGFPYSAKA